MHAVILPAPSAKLPNVVPRSMRAVVLSGHGGLEALNVEKAWPVPEPCPDEVLIAVSACAVNATDVNTRSGWYGRGQANGGWGGPIAFPRIQGADVCGRVVACGDSTSSRLLGERVLVDPWLRDPEHPDDVARCGYLGSERDGGYAEYVTVPARNVHPVRSTLSDVELASFATSAGTAENMLQRADVQSGETVLVTGASGGVGTALVQLVRRRRALPFAVCASEKVERVRALGAEAVLSRDDDLATQLRTVGLEAVDVVADVVGGELWASLIGLLRRGGRYTVAGAIGGPLVELDLRTVYLADLTLTGVAVTPPGLFGDLVGYIERGEISPCVAARYALEQAREAQQAFADKRHVGKIVLDILP
jgi:NADPH:quinone reductase-like Zn-dependent oxidoreductase